MNPAQRAIPDVMLNMTSATRFVTQGYMYTKDLQPLTVHPAMSDLFAPAMNPASLILGRFFMQMQSTISAVAVAPAYPIMDRSAHFSEKVSVHSARGRIKQACSRIPLDKVCQEIATNHSHHLHLLPSILTPEMPYPLVSMCLGVSLATAWPFALLCKLRLQVYDPNNLPLCWCLATHDCWADHAFPCKKNNKKMVHNFCIKGMPKGLQPTEAMAGYIRPTAKLEPEKAHLLVRDKGIRPLDLSFDPDPSPDHTHMHRVLLARWVGISQLPLHHPLPHSLSP